jgi:hypothetical protein
MSTFQLTPEQIESMTDEQIAEAYAQFKATNSLLQKRVAKAKRSGAIASTSKPNTLASVITANRANALAQNALGKAQTRANATAAALDSARSGFLAAQGREELTAEEQTQLDESARISVEKAEAAYAKVRQTMAGKNTQAIHAARVGGNAEAPDESAPAEEADETNEAEAE